MVMTMMMSMTCTTSDYYFFVLIWKLFTWNDEFLWFFGGILAGVINGQTRKCWRCCIKCVTPEKKLEQKNPMTRPTQWVNELSVGREGWLLEFSVLLQIQINLKWNWNTKTMLMDMAKYKFAIISRFLFVRLSNFPQPWKWNIGGRNWRLIATNEMK